MSGVRDAAEAAGASRLYLPPYSPDFNPIELAFAKLKAELCSAPPRPGPSPTYGPPSEPHSTSFTPAECRNYFAAAGYDGF